MPASERFPCIDLTATTISDKDSESQGSFPLRRRSNAFHCDRDENELAKAIWSEKAHFNPYAKARKGSEPARRNARLEELLQRRGEFFLDGSPLSQIWD